MLNVTHGENGGEVCFLCGCTRYDGMGGKWICEWLKQVGLSGAIEFPAGHRRDLQDASGVLEGSRQIADALKNEGRKKELATRARISIATEERRPRRYAP